MTAHEYAPPRSMQEIACDALVSCFERRANDASFLWYALAIKAGRSDLLPAIGEIAEQLDALRKAVERGSDKS